MVVTNTKEDTMLDLVQIISMHNISVDGIKTINRLDKKVYEIKIYVTNVEQLDKLILSLNKNKHVEHVERVIL